MRTFGAYGGVRTHPVHPPLVTGLALIVRKQLSSFDPCHYSLPLIQIVDKLITNSETRDDNNNRVTPTVKDETNHISIVKRTVKAPTQRSFLHRRTNSISICSAADSSTLLCLFLLLSWVYIEAFSSTPWFLQPINLDNDVQLKQWRWVKLDIYYINYIHKWGTLWIYLSPKE